MNISNIELGDNLFAFYSYMGFIFCGKRENGKYNVFIASISREDSSIDIVKTIGDFDQSDEGLYDAIPYCCGWVDIVHRAVESFYLPEMCFSIPDNKPMEGVTVNVQFTTKFAIA